MHARQIVWEWGLAALAESVELVVSELITNAVRASEGLRSTQLGVTTVQLWLSADHRGVLVQVWDANEQLPQRREPDPEADSGRGLTIVEAVSDSVGVYRLEGENGKVVWAFVRAQ